MAHAAIRILVVEDNPLIALLMQVTLGNMGYCVVGPAMNLAEALAHVQSGDIDFALLDFDLGDGTDVSPAAAALAARGIGFAFTSDTSPNIIRKAFREAPVLPKPVHEEDLARVLPANPRHRGGPWHKGAGTRASHARV